MSKKQTGFWSSLLGYQAPREKFSLEELQHLHELLRNNSVVTDQNRDDVVEALRAIAELMIWGDQHDPRFFEFFLEHNLMRHFSKFLVKSSNRKGEVAKQVLQTLYILIQNIRSQTAIYYIFSNNHVNDIVTLTFDFEDDEVLGYYINLLKTISLRLTTKTVQFFFQSDGEHSSFPLYTEAIKFINHKEGMVRAAVRTLTLSVYAIDDEAIRHFLVSKPASNYFNELAIVIAEQCQLLDRKLSTLEAGTSNAAYSLETDLADIEDMLSYCNDILCTGEPRLSRLLVQCLWGSFVRPVLIEPLQQLAVPGAPSGARVGPLCSLSILERLMHTINHEGLADGLASALTLPPQHESAKQEQGLVGESGICHSSGGCREGFLAALKSGEPVLAAAAVRVILALIQNRALDPDILDASGLLPQTRRKKKQLLDILTSDGTADAGHPATGNLFADKDRQADTTELEQPSTSEVNHGTGKQRPISAAGDSAAGCTAWRGRSHMAGRGRAGSGPADSSQWVEVLCDLLMLDLLPCTAVWVTGHLLMQLLEMRKSGASVTASQQERLESALRRMQATFAAQVGGMWTDALPVLVCMEWERASTHLNASSLQSTTTAVQAWMQAIQAQKLEIESGDVPHGLKSARAAAVAVHAVQRLVAMLQTQQGLLSGQLAPQLPIPPASELHMKRNEAREGMQLKLQSPAVCTVSFSRGAERNVLFAVHGMPQVSTLQDANSGQQVQLSQEEQMAVSSSSPSVLLASPSTGGDTGAEACVDKLHKRWLHVHVRPNARGLLKTIRGAAMGECMHQVEQQLVDGHWVLSFESPDLAHAALEHVEQQAALIRGLIRGVLAPLLG